jgi:serine/threonine protein phosphatase PrpC
MDGHGGYNGMIASQTAKDATLTFFQQHSNALESWTIDQWEGHLTSLFLAIHDAIRNRFMTHTSQSPHHGAHSERRYVDDKGIVRTATDDPVHGGSTCTIVALISSSNSNEATVISANVGDSTALLLPVYKDNPPHSVSQPNYEFLSTDHGPENQHEYLRIKSMQLPTRLLLVYDKTSIMRKYECPPVFQENGEREESLVSNPWGHGLHPTNVRYEPAVYAVTPRTVTKDSTCIAMTRALGDFYAHQFGLSAVPDINVKHIQLSEDGGEDGLPVSYTLIVASDGE